MASQVEKTTNRIAKIVLGLRFFSRDGSQDSSSSIDVQKLIDETLSFCSERFKMNGTRLIIDKFSERLEFEGRATEISQVLLNLLNNANDAIIEQKEKWIRVSVLEKKNWLEIRVIDCGNGISQELQKKIFQPFFTTKGIGKGTGMGLSISMGIVRSHGGELELDNLSLNTCFVVRVPKKQIKGNTQTAA